MWESMLQALGLLALIAVTALGGGIWYLRRRIRRWHHYGLAAAVNRFPGRLRLRPVETFQWRKGERAARRTTALRELGFRDLGGFHIDELPDARLFVLCHPTSRLVALVQEQDELGTWTDVAAFVAGEDQPVWASSILRRAHLHLLPGDPRLHHPAAEESVLVEAAKKAAGNGERWLPATPGEFRERFEDVFARAVDSRLLQPLEDYELRRLVRERREASGCTAGGGESEGAGIGLDDAEFAGLKAHLPAAINNELRLVCAAQFLRETTLPASDWKQARERLAVIHDRTPLPELVGRLVYGVCWTPALKKRLKRARREQEDPRTAFARLNAVLPPWERYKKIGEVSHPVPADIYRAPLEDGTGG